MQICCAETLAILLVPYMVNFGNRSNFGFPIFKEVNFLYGCLTKEHINIFKTNRLKHASVTF